MTRNDVWITQGFEAFRQGTFGNGGQNLYVSKAGVLQRIFRYDFRNTGHFDLLFVNSQDMDERPPVYVYDDLLNGVSRTDLPTRGAYAAAVGDLNGDGFDDLVIGHQCDGSFADLTAFVYYGTADGFSERYKLELPAPNCRAVAIGDFDGDGLPEILFASNGRLRVFSQADGGFIPSRFTELEIDCVHMVAADLDGDGFADLYARPRQGPALVLWGGPDGLDTNHATVIPGVDKDVAEGLSTTPDWVSFILSWRPKILSLGGVPHLFRGGGPDALLVPVHSDRSLGEPLVFPGIKAAAAAGGDINGNGHDDVVLVCHAPPDWTRRPGYTVYPDRSATSWIYWGGPEGFDPTHRTSLETLAARDVVVVDLDGNGFSDVVVCQGSNAKMHDVESLIFKGCASGILPEPVRIEGLDPTSVLTARPSEGTRSRVIFVNHAGGRVRGDVPLYLYHGGPDGYSPDRREEIPGWSAPDAIGCDFDDDGWADLFVSNCAENAPHLDPGSFLYQGGPNGFSSDRKTVFPTFRAHGSAVGDFRRSGYLDIAVVGFCNPEMRIFRQGPNGFDLEHFDRILLDPELQDFTPSRACWSEAGVGNPAYREPRWLLAADFNGDGWLDIFVSQISGPRCLILWGGPEGYSMKRCQWLNTEGSACAQAADLTGNGWLDLVIGGHQSLGNANKYDSSVTIYWGGPEGYREDRRTQLPIHGCNSLTIADFNRDGILDIFATCYKNGRVRDLDSYIYWGAPGGAYSVTNRKRLFSHSASGCLAADFNGDGWVDIAVASHKTHGNHVGHSQIWWNGPEGFSEERRTRLPTLGPHGMVAVDPGNIKDRGPEEFYESAPNPMPDGCIFNTIRWESIEPPKTWVRAQIRTAESPEALEQAPWRGPKGTGEWFTKGEPVEGSAIKGKWIQYRLALGSAAGANSPRVTSVTVTVRPVLLLPENVIKIADTYFPGKVSLILGKQHPTPDTRHPTPDTRHSTSDPSSAIAAVRACAAHGGWANIGRSAVACRTFCRSRSVRRGDRRRIQPKPQRIFMKIVVLDGATLNPGDLSWAAVEALGDCMVYDRTPPAQVIERAREAEIVLTNKTALNGALLAQLPRLRLICVLATGYNVVDTAVARERGIPVCNVPAYSTSSVAQMTFALLLELVQRAGHHSQTVREGRWCASPDFAYWDGSLIELDGLTMGLIGYGSIGQAVARIARAFGMRVVAHVPTPRVADVELVGLETLLRTSDVVSLHCPLTARNGGMIDRAALAMMKPSAFLINTARGALIDEHALADALNAGRLAGAGLDVLSAEPPPSGNPLLLARNCLITPHIAWATRAARKRLMATVADNISAYLSGSLRNVVN